MQLIIWYNTVWYWYWNRYCKLVSTNRAILDYNWSIRLPSIGRSHRWQIALLLWYPWHDGPACPWCLAAAVHELLLLLHCLWGVLASIAAMIRVTDATRCIVGNVVLIGTVRIAVLLMITIAILGSWIWSSIAGDQGRDSERVFTVKTRWGAGSENQADLN